MNRSVGVTNMNEHSSRSHSIFSITLESRLVQDEEDETVKISRLVREGRRGWEGWWIAIKEEGGREGGQTEEKDRRGIMRRMGDDHCDKGLL